VGAFQVNVPAPPALTWTNRLQIGTVDRSQPLTVNWTPDGLSGSLVLVSGANYDVPSNATRWFVCTASGAAASFSIPAYILSSLPASRPQVGQSAGSILLSVFPSSMVVPFTASGLNQGFGVELVSSAKTVLFQ
jgi:hypothetical protein